MNPFLQFLDPSACHRIMLVAANFSALAENVLCNRAQAIFNQATGAVKFTVDAEARCVFGFEPWYGSNHRSPALTE